MSATLALAAWASRVGSGGLPPDTTRAAVRAYLDFLACTVAGAGTDAARKVRDGLGTAFTGQGRSTLLGTGAGASAHAAAFLNAHASHVLEFDDLHGPSIYHPGGPTVAAALAVAEREGVDGPTLLSALVAGYEVGIRLGKAAGKSHYARFHNTGTVGTVGACVAAGRVLGLSPEAMADAIGTATTHAAGLWAFGDDDADSKPLHPAHAAMMGAMSADLARAGVRGARTGLEGPRGFLASLGGDPDSDHLLSGLGAAPEMIRETTFKAYPCCGHTHTGIDAAVGVRHLLQDRRERSGGIVEVRVETYASAIVVAGVARPRTPAEASFSYPHVVAWSLLHPTMDEAFFPAALEDAAVRSLAARVSLLPSPAFDAAYPASQPARVAVRTEDGETFSAERHHPKGSPWDPLSDEEHERKVEGLLGADAAISIEHARSLPLAADVRLPS